MVTSQMREQTPSTSGMASFDTPQSSAAGDHISPPSASITKDVSVRILKKRESDRRCQRIKRERTKSKIAALEERVRNFGTQDSTGQVQLLMKQLQAVERERDELATKVKTIESVIRDGATKKMDHNTPYTRPDLSTSADASPSTAESFEQDTTVQKNRLSHTEQKGLDFNSGHTEEFRHSSSCDQPYSDPVENVVLEVYGEEGSAMSSSTNPSDGQPCECCSTSEPSMSGPQFNTWRFTNQVLSSRFRWPAYFQLLQDVYRDDIPVRAVVEGWDAIEARGPMHPSWQILKRLDQTLFRNSNQKERLAVMYAVQLLLMSHTSPEALPELPSFYRKRSSRRITDSYAIHFFPWPGMRDRFVLYQHRYCTNDFWNTFISSLRIMWQFEFRDCYTKNVETGLYSMSPLFQERVNDINSWAMDADVFIKWPELRADIPIYNSIPQSVSNMNQRPQKSKVITRAVVRKPRARSSRHGPGGSPQASQPEYIQPYFQAAMVTSAPYYSQASVYGLTGKAGPSDVWHETTLQQPLESIGYGLPTSNPVNVTTEYLQ